MTMNGAHRRSGLHGPYDERNDFPSSGLPTQITHNVDGEAVATLRGYRYVELHIFSRYMAAEGNLRPHRLIYLMLILGAILMWLMLFGGTESSSKNVLALGL